MPKCILGFPKEREIANNYLAIMYVYDGKLDDYMAKLYS